MYIYIFNYTIHGSFPPPPTVKKNAQKMTDRVLPTILSPPRPASKFEACGKTQPSWVNGAVTFRKTNAYPYHGGHLSPVRNIEL